DVRQVCDEVIWIKKGRVHMQGLPQDVTLAYANYERSLDHNPESLAGGMARAHGEGLPVIDALRLQVEKGGTRSPLPDTVRTGAALRLELDFTVRRAGQGVNVGVAIFRTDNVLAATFNSQLEGIPSVTTPGRHRCRMRLPDLRLNEGEYTVVGYLFDEH